jgi:hypothetical protein
MRTRPTLLLFTTLAVLAGPGPAQARVEPRTVCTVTINSADEREVFQRHLPREQFRFVELVQRGRPDWLADARRRGVRCDVLVISGHFDDGTEFYTDRHDDREFLTVPQMQHESCTATPAEGLFSRLQEVYLFGCNTLKDDPRHVAQPEVLRSLQRAGLPAAEAERRAAWLNAHYGQSNRDRLRHIFKDVPVIYGFASKAPLGRVAGPLLERYFQTAPAGEVAGGRPSATLLNLFGPTSMIAVSGVTDADPHAGFRQDLCRLADDRPPAAQQLHFVHQLLQRDVTEVRMALDHLERYMAGLPAAQRARPDVALALSAIADDQPSRERYLALARDTDDAAVGARMLALARQLGWLSAAQEQDEFVRLLAVRMGQGSLGTNEVDLACTAPMPHDGSLARRLQAVAQPARAADAAVLACLGQAEAHERTLRALTGTDEQAVALAQVYLRHRPLADVAELRSVTAGIARMTAAAAQLRALQAMARQRWSDAQSLQAVAQLFPRARSLDVQRAIAGILVRSDHQLLPRAELARLLRQTRLKSPDGSDVIDLLIRLLQSA